jgi:hypothetical protein
VHESSLANKIPLWRTLREEGTTVLVTPALDYVGALELGCLHVDFAGEDSIAGIGDGLRNLVAGMEDGTTLHFLYRTEVGAAEADIRAYEAQVSENASPALRAHVADRAAWLRRQPLRLTRIYLFFSQGPETGRLTRGALGGGLAYAGKKGFTKEEHLRRVKSLSMLRDRIVARLNAVQLPSRELDLEDVWRLHYALLNPTRARSGIPAPNVTVRSDLFSEEQIRREGAWLAEYTEAEQLVHEDISDETDSEGRALGLLRQGPLFRRVLTLKTLPESGTGYYSIEGFLRGLRTEAGPLPFTLAVTIQVKNQQKAQRDLSNRHELVAGLKEVIPFLSNNSVKAREQEAAQKESIRALFEELNSMSTKVVALSVSLLLEADAKDRLENYTEIAKTAFAVAGNAQAQDETWTQIPAFLSMLPAAGPYQLRQKGCSSLNAGDFLPVYAAWTGNTKPVSIFQTPGGDVVRYDPFDKRLVNASHGVICADTGSGKSVWAAAVVLDARASGVEAVLIDNGGSWAALTEVLGGIHVPVDLHTSISPFISYEEMWDAANNELSPEELDAAAGFIEVVVQDRTRGPFDNTERAAVTRALTWCYETKFKNRPDVRPLIGDFDQAFLEYPWEHDKDREAMQDLHRRLEIFVTGIYRNFLNKPSNVRWDVPLITFDMAKVAENPVTKAVALATIIQALGNRAMKRRVPTLAVIDEAHEYLGDSSATAEFLGRAYRKYRKVNIAMFTISQSIADWVNTRVGKDAILGNAMIKVFLRHQAGKQPDVIRFFGMSPRMATAFSQLSMRPGHYSDFLLMYGPRTTVVRLAMSGLEYWLLTTDPKDKELVEKAQAKNPHLGKLEILQGLARLYPNGAVGGVR